MSGPEETVLAYWKEHRDQLRQSENQRAVLTNYVLVIVAALSGFIVQQQLRPATLPLSCLILVIGLYGALTVAKYHERATYHLSQARALTRQLIGLGALPNYATELDQARQSHYTTYPRLHRIRLHILWTTLHLAIATYGATLIIVTVAR